MKLLKKKWVIIALLLFLIVGGGLVIRQRSSASRTASAITTAKVQRENFVNTVSSSGKTAADKSVELKFQTSGKLAWVGVKEGDSVNAYQVIATLDAREVQKTLEKALRDYSLERNDFEEARQVTYGFKQPTDVGDTIKRILEKNQWDLEKAVLDVELKSLAVEYSRLVTPITGVVTHIDTPVAGVNITPATAVFAIADPGSLVFTANVDETDIGSLSLGQKATIMLDAFPEETFSGTISFISYTSEQSSGGATVFPVKIAFDAPQDVFRIGLNGDIEIETDRQDDVLTVPTEAIREDKDGLYVYRKTDGTYEVVRVTTGAKSDDEVVVNSGLTEGDTVVTKGFTALPK